MGDQTWGPGADPVQDDADAPYRAPDRPISVVPAAAPDYAELLATDDPEPVAPIELHRVPVAAESYEPARVYEDGPPIVAQPAAPEPAAPIVEVPLASPLTPDSPGEVIVDVPADVRVVPLPALEGPEEPAPDLIAGVPTDVPPAPRREQAEPADRSEPPARTPWWKLLLGE